MAVPGMRRAEADSLAQDIRDDGWRAAVAPHPDDDDGWMVMAAPPPRKGTSAASACLYVYDWREYEQSRRAVEREQVAEASRHDQQFFNPPDAIAQYVEPLRSPADDEGRALFEAIIDRLHSSFMLQVRLRIDEPMMTQREAWDVMNLITQSEPGGWLVKAWRSYSGGVMLQVTPPDSAEVALVGILEDWMGAEGRYRDRVAARLSEAQKRAAGEWTGTH